MSDPFLGEIRMFGGDFAPLGWALCQGQLLLIEENEALYTILGTKFGGNGQTNFALPDLRSRVAIGAGQGTGLSDYDVGQMGGDESVTLTASQVPSLGGTGSVQINGSSNEATSKNPTGKLPAVTEAAAYDNSQSGGIVAMNANMASLSSLVVNPNGGQPHPNIQPYSAVSFIICLQGVYPSS